MFPLVVGVRVTVLVPPAIKTVDTGLICRWVLFAMKRRGWLRVPWKFSPVILFLIFMVKVRVSLRFTTSQKSFSIEISRLFTNSFPTKSTLLKSKEI